MTLETEDNLQTLDLGNEELEGIKKMMIKNQYSELRGERTATSSMSIIGQVPTPHDPDQTFEKHPMFKDIVN